MNQNEARCVLGGWLEGLDFKKETIKKDKGLFRKLSVIYTYHVFFCISILIHHFAFY